MTQAEIAALRLSIGEIDEEILRLVAIRMDIAREIGKTKRKCGVDIRDAAQEERVVHSTVERAAHLGVSEDTALRISRALIDCAVEVQAGSEERVLTGTKALIVGSGRMGAWTSRFLSNRGADVSVYDPRGTLQGYKNVDSLDDIVPDVDLIVIASPLGVAADDLRHVLSLRPSGVVFDVCSVKSHIRELLADAADEGLKVTSVHPMFGPSSPTPRGENVLICSCGSGEADEVARKLFEGAGARVSEVQMDRHDEFIATVLGLPHIATLLFGRVASNSGLQDEELEALQGPSFRRMSRLARDTASESRRVYHDIQKLNPHTDRTLESMMSALVELRTASLSEDSSKFREIMDEQKKYFGGG